MRRSSIPYLFRRGDWFYFRAAVPQALRSRMGGKPEIKIALGTRDPRVARIRCRYLSNAFERFPSQVASMTHLSVEQVQGFARQYFQERLNEAYELADDIPADPDIDQDFEIAALKEDVDRHRKSLGKRQFNHYVRIQAQEMLDGLKPPGADVDPDIFSAACETVVRAEIEKCRYLIAMLSGNPAESAPVDPLFVGMMPTGYPPIKVTTFELDGEDQPSDRTLETTANEFIAKKAKAVWVGKTEADYRRVLGWACDIIGGNRHLDAIATQDVKAFRDALASMPANLAKLSGLDGMSLSDMARAEHNAEPMSIRTQDKYFSMFRGFLRWCLQEELIDKMPGMSVRVIGAGQGHTRSDRVHSKDQLAAIFSSPLFHRCRSRSRRAALGDEAIRDAYYWIPVVAYLTGMRLGEIVQLRVTDVREMDGVAYFDVNKGEDDKKRLKTISSARKIPVPQPLLDLGFMEVVDRCKKTGRARLFHEVQCGADGYYSHNFSKWWGRYARKIEAHRSGTSFHSFRHDFKDAIAASDAPEAVTKALMGHSDRSVHASYGSGPSLERMKQAIDRARHQIDIVAILNP